MFVVNGVNLQGIVTWFDNFSLLLKRDQQVQLVYKHAISTIMPVGAVSLQEIGVEGTGDETGDHTGDEAGDDAGV